MQNNFQDTTEQIYNQRAQSLFKKDPTNRWDHFYSKLTTDHWLLDQIKIDNKTVLNIGCAQPRDEIAFSHRVKQWTAIDINPEIVKASFELARQRLHPTMLQRLQFKQADATKLPFKDSTFDISVAFSTIDHIPTQQKRIQAIKEMSRVTKNGGYVIITVPNKLNFCYDIWLKNKQRHQQSQAGYEYCFFPWELKKIMQQAGLKTLKFASNFKWSPGIWFNFFRTISFPLEYLGFRMGYLSQKIK